MIPKTGETLFYVDLDEVENLSEAEVWALCKELGLAPQQEERLIMLTTALPEDDLMDAHCELAHRIIPGHLAVHLRGGLLAVA